MEGDMCMSCRMSTSTSPECDIRVLGGKPWHAACLCCSVCRIDMKCESMCFFKNGLLLCYPDYARYYGDTCPKCAKGFNLDDMVRVIKEKKYHADCFTCDLCLSQMITGEKFMYNEGQILCKLHYNQSNTKLCNRKMPVTATEILDDPSYEPSPAKDCDSHLVRSRTTLGKSRTMQPSATSCKSLTIGTPTVSHDESKHTLAESRDVEYNYRRHGPCIPKLDECEKRSNGSYCDSDQHVFTSLTDACVNYSDEVSRPKKRRNRTVITEYQLNILEDCYKKSKYIDIEAMQEVSEVTGLTMKSVKIWFQNKRRLDKEVLAVGMSVQQLSVLKECYQKSKYIDASAMEEVIGATGLTTSFIKTWFDNKRRLENEVLFAGESVPVTGMSESDYSCMTDQGYLQYNSHMYLPYQC